MDQWIPSALVLAYPTSEGTFVLDTDASKMGIRAVLSQKLGERKRLLPV